jgi:transposase
VGFASSWLQSLKSWSLRKSRRGSLTQTIEQLELGLEELEIGVAQSVPDVVASEATPACAPPAVAAAPEGATDKPKRNRRRPLPEHLPRTEQVHLPDPCRCAACGGGLRQVGEDVTEILDYLPGRFVVVRHVRPAF